jgi:hypothetical protein
MIRFTKFALFLLIGVVGACGSDKKGPPPPTFSPNGEPLIGGNWPPVCEDAMAAWFDRVNASHDGKLTYAQLEADAQRQYALMDLRHDGKVTAAELSAYRLKVMGGHFLSVSTPGQHNTLERDPNDPSGLDASRAFGDPEGRRKKDDDESRKRIDAFAALTTDQPDPVMTADTDLDGSVTWDEFRALVAQNFADFDKQHKGVVTKDEVRASCER